MNYVILLLPLFPLFVSSLKKNSSTWMVYSLYILILIFFIALRSGSSAGDYMAYRFVFEDYNKSMHWFDLFLENSGVGFFFAFFSHYLSDYWILIFIYSVIPLLFFAVWIWKQTSKPFLALFFLLSLFYFQYGIEQYRQFVALGIVAYAISQKKKANKVCLVFLAALFHPTAAVAFAICFIPNRILDGKVYIIALIVTFAFSFILGNYLTNLFGGFSYVSDRVDFYQRYAEQQDLEYGFITTALIIRLFFFFLFYYNRKRMNDKYFPYMLNIYFLSIVFYKLFSFIPELATRGSVYFTLVEPLLLCYYFSLNRRKFVYLVGVIVLLLSLYRQFRAWQAFDDFEYTLINFI